MDALRYAESVPDAAADSVAEPLDLSTLKARTFASAVWSIVRIGWNNAANIAIFLVLARLLAPRAFGVFALATVVVEVTRVVAGAGFSDVILRERTVDEDLADTLFWANVGLGLIVGAAILVLAGGYGALMHQPELTHVLWALAPLVPLSSLGGVHLARKLRDFGHRAVAARAMTASVLGGFGAIVGAFSGWGVWSLVVEAVILDTVGLVFAWRNYPWRPRLVFKWARLKGVLAFSSGMMATQLLWLMIGRVPDLFIGRRIGATAVGVYRVAMRMIDLIGQTVLAPVGSVAMITFARLQDDPVRFRRAYTRMVGLVALLTLPAILGFGVVSQEAIAVIFGSRWLASAPIASVLCMVALPITLNYFSAPALAAKNQSRRMLQIAAIQLVSTVAMVACAAPFGLLAVAASYTARTYLTMPVSQWMLTKYAHIDMGAVVRAVLSPLLAALVMCAALLVLRPLLVDLAPALSIRLLVQTSAGALIYFAALFTFARPLITSYAHELLPLLRRA